MKRNYPETPDGRCFVVKGRLWRKSDPGLDAAKRAEVVQELMAASRAVHAARGDAEATTVARKRVDVAKRGLGERGPLWWTDGSPDYSRHLVKNTPYAAWHASLDEQD